MEVESTLTQTLNSNKKPNKLRSIRFPRLSFLKKTSSKNSSKSKFSCLSIDPTIDNLSSDQLSLVKMPDLSPNYMKVTTSYDAKKGSTSQKGIGSVDEISIDSSTSRSLAAELSAQNKDDKIKNRPVMKKIMKNFGSTRSFRRRSRSVIKSPISDYAASSHNSSSVDVSESSPPHYRKTTSCSEGKSYSHSSLHNSYESSFDSSDQSRSPKKYVQSLSRTTSMRSVKILINKASFKSKRGSSKCCQIPDKATCSSTLKDSKFREHVVFPPGQTESDRISKFKVCSYHHCSLHGGHYDDPSPPVKRVYRRKRVLKSQKSIRMKSESRNGEKFSEMTQFSPSADPSVCVESNTKEDAGFYQALEYADLAEIAFGETSFPEQSYQETLNIMRKYSTQEQDTHFTASTCCNCMARERSESVSVTDAVDSKDDSTTASAVFGHRERNLSLVLKQDDSVSTSGKDESNNKTRSVLDIFNGAKCSSANTQSEDGLFTNRTRSVFDIFHGEKCSSENSSVSARNIQLELGNIQEKDGKADLDEDVDSTSGSAVDSESKNCLPLEVAEPKKKHMSMWSMIRRHMIPDASAESENKSSSGVNEESSDSCSAFVERELIPANEDAENQEVELRKLFAIKLVREAIERILLPEVQSDDQSVTSESSADQESLEMNHIEVSTKENLESKSLNTEDIGGSEKEPARKDVKSKPEKRAPKHWSNLKKWILLQRFVKELEKVRKINPRKPRVLQLNPDPEAEKVNLRPQTADERKRGEEWMLDYALQKAISQLAPTQQRKVELLIKAFETVVPPQGDNSQVAFPNLRASSEEHLQITSKDNELVTRAGDVSSVSECEATENATISSDEKVKEADNVELQESHKSTAVDLHSVARDRKLELDNHDGELSDSSAAVSIQSSTSACDAAMQENVAIAESAKEREKAPKAVRGFSLLFAMSDPKKNEAASQNQVDKRNYISMWHMISQHVLSDVASKVGNELLDGTDDEVEDSNTPTRTRTCNSRQDFTDTKDEPDTSREDHNPIHNGRNFCRDDAVKLIREAVNEILTTPIQDDSSDTQSITSDITMDQGFSDMEGEAKNSSNSTEESLTNHGMSEDGKTLDQETKGPEANTISTEEDKSLALTKNKIEPQKSKNWSKLKKLILLKRSIKALEKARKFNPRAPQLLPPTPDQEPETVDLRHQMTDERKKAEKWMLDYAMQHIVTTLTPARKKRVAMLVEAFEAVVPLPEI
ncbi:uncharacterized protein [Nicotiana sylvestris]|uniref:Uncharacterized protein LOC104235712 n=1 Tax=Nicotiana sylvestris TaxID=4096 RepID=A0A1U7XAE1_NICSY|nr:PREDICTED: uncharacterized protein LOC104235712 [Nicotiana sylvestris]